MTNFSGISALYRSGQYVHLLHIFKLQFIGLFLNLVSIHE